MVLAPQAPYYRLMPKRREATNLAPAPTPLGQFIREQRNARGWSQDNLADRAEANLTFTSISNIERGKVSLPDPPAMIGIARAFGMHVCDLYAEAGYPEFRVLGYRGLSPERREVFDLVVGADEARLPQIAETVRLIVERRPQVEDEAAG